MRIKRIRLLTTFNKSNRHSDPTRKKRTLIYIKSQVYTENEVTGSLKPSAHLENCDDLMTCAALTTTQKRQNTVLIKNFLQHPYTLKKVCHIATSSLRTLKQAKYIEPVNPAPMRNLLDTNHVDFIHYIKAIIFRKFNETNWFPTTQEPGDETQRTPIQKHIPQELIALQKLELLNPQDIQ